MSSKDYIRIIMAILNGSEEKRRKAIEEAIELQKDDPCPYYQIERIERK